MAKTALPGSRASRALNRSLSAVQDAKRHVDGGPLRVLHRIESNLLVALGRMLPDSSTMRSRLRNMPRAIRGFRARSGRKVKVSTSPK